MAKAKETTQPMSEAASWLSEIELAINDAKDYRDRCKVVRDQYLYVNSKRAKDRRMQIFWANVETMRPKVYNRPPKAVAASRWRDGDPKVRVSSMALERGLQFQIDYLDYDRVFKLVRDDYLLYARGTARLRYEPVFSRADVETQVDDASSEGAERAGELEGEAANSGEVLKFENVQLDFIQGDDFIHPKCRIWEELPWLAFRAFLTKDEIRKRWPDAADKIEFNTTAATDKVSSSMPSRDQQRNKATIYEIWDKLAGKVRWIARGCDEILEEADPYLKFEGFFPCPRPAYGTLPSDEMYPRPDYIFFQDQIEEIDQLTARIGALTDALKVVGFYPSGPQGEGSPEIERALKPGTENKLIAVKAWDMFQKQGGGGAPIIWVPVDQVAKVITECIALRKELIQDVYNVTGISDVLRGQTDPNETLGAQQIKQDSSDTRLSTKQKEMARFARDVIAMLAEVMSQQFQITSILEMSGISLPSQADVQAQQQQYQQQVVLAKGQAAQAAQVAPPGQRPQQPNLPPPPAMPECTVEDVEQLLRNAVLRRFRVEIETDSTIAADQAQEQAARSQFLESITKMVTAWAPIVQAKPQLMPVMGQFMLFGVRAFPVARELEEVIEKAVEELSTQMSQPQQPPPPSPTDQLKFQTEQTKANAQIQTAQIKAQAETMKAQAEIAQAKIDGEGANAEFLMDQQRHSMEMAKMEAEHQRDMQKLAMQAAQPQPVAQQ